MREALRSGSWLTPERLTTYPMMIVALGLVGLVISWWTGDTPLTDRFGRPIGTDFAGVYTAGRMLLAGDTAGLFDPATHFAFQRAFFGVPDIEVYGWHYPPFFLAIAAFLATLPYIPALIVWQASTFALYVLMLQRVVAAASAGRDRTVMILAVGFPATLVTLAHGHNAFLSAVLLGFGLLWLDRRPILAGMMIGLLAYKPQFGLVLPLVMALGGHWRAICAAAATVAFMCVVSTLVLGTEVWSAFLTGAAFTREVVLEQGATGWYKIQSVFSAARFFGGSIGVAYAAQAVATLGVLAALAAMVLAGADRRIVAAATATAALLATPYCLDYDMAILGVAIAFTAAHALEKGFAPFEISLLALAWFVPLAARGVKMTTGLPLGLLVMFALFCFLVHRGFAGRSLASVLAAISTRASWSSARGQLI
jgi:hypothetical protein